MNTSFREQLSEVKKKLREKKEENIKDDIKKIISDNVGDYRGQADKIKRYAQKKKYLPISKSDSDFIIRNWELANESRVKEALNDELYREEIRRAISELKKLNKPGTFNLVIRERNDLCIDDEDAMMIIAELEDNMYFDGPMADTDKRKLGEVWVFKPDVYLEGPGEEPTCVYLKVRIEASKLVVVISLHEDEIPIKFSCIL